MPAFSFEALDRDGAMQRGVLEADTPRAARALLRERGLAPLDVSAVSEASARGSFSLHRGLSPSQLATLARQLATLIGAGLPIDEALSALAEQNDEPRVRAIVSSVRARVLEGRTLAAALGEFPDSFPEMFRASVAAGEQSGHLDSVLEKLADHAESREALSRQVWAALAYPVLLTIVSLLIVTGLLTWVVPKVVGVFENMQQELPLLTRLLIGSSALILDWGWLIALVLIASVFAIRWAMRNPATRARWHAWRLGLPLVGKLLRGADTARMTRTLAMLTASGVPVLDALRLATPTVRNLPMQAALRQAAARVREGGGFARALADSGQFPPVTVRLIASGERTGKLDEMLEQAARAQTREVEAMLSTLSAVLGPAIILGVGVMVLLIVLAILMPIFQLNSLIA